MIAIAFKNGWIRAARADLEDSSLVLNQLESRPLPLGLKSPDIRSAQLAELLQDLFREIFSSPTIPDRDVFLSLGEEWAESLLLDVDSRLSSEENEEYLNWILKQRLGLLWDETVAFFQKVSDGEHATYRILACLVVKTLIEHMKGALDAVGAIPRWMESSVQSVGRVVTSREEGTEARAVTLEPHGQEFRAQCYDRGELMCLADMMFHSGKFRSISVKGDSPFAAQCLYDLNSLVAADKSEARTDFHLFLVGEFSEKHLRLLTRKKAWKDQITLLNPFSHMKSGQVELPPSKIGSWFVDILGLLLLKLD